MPTPDSPYGSRFANPWGEARYLRLSLFVVVAET
jgi:hypothetical protein